MIRTNRLNFEPLCTEHAKDLFEIWTDFEVIKYTYMTLLKSFEECCAKINLFIEYNNENGIICNFAILYNEKAIGICGFPLIDAKKAEYGFYYQISRKYWGKGFGFEAANSLLDYILSEVNVECIFAEVVSINPASIAILTHLGFRKTHIQTGGFTKNDMVLDLVHFKYDKLAAMAKM